MEILSSSDHSKLSELFFERFLRALEKLFSQKEIFIGLSGGSSLDIFYVYIQNHFREIPEEIRMKIRFAFLDERIVSVDHPDSNEWQLRKKLLAELVEEGSIGETQIIGISSFLVPVIPATRSPKYYEGWKAGIQKPETLDSVINTEWQTPGEFLRETYSFLVPRIDIALFGVWPDGHIASLFPYHPLLSSPEKWYLEITDSPKPPAHRITVSPTMIHEISYTFIAFMRGKEEAFANFRDSEKSIQECPAKMLISDRTVVMSDIDE